VRRRRIARRRYNFHFLVNLSRIRFFFFGPSNWYAFPWCRCQCKVVVMCIILPKEPISVPTPYKPQKVQGQTRSHEQKLAKVIQKLMPVPNKQSKTQRRTVEIRQTIDLCRSEKGQEMRNDAEKFKVKVCESMGRRWQYQTGESQIFYTI
jgi:hypothetical protein